jgi:hypothetical protein
MRKITIHTVNDEILANKLVKTFDCLYHYDTVTCITDDAYEVFRESNNRHDDILISISVSEDNYTYLYFWESGVNEMKLASYLNKHILLIPNALPSSDFISKNADAIYMKIELGKGVSPIDIAKGVYEFFEA